MQQHWNELCEQVENTDKELESFLENGGLTNSVMKKIGGFIKAWNILKKRMQDFDQFVTPVEPILNILPWETTVFAETWKFWREYLQEQHGQVLRSRAEKASLAYLESLAGSSEEEAIKIINFTCYLRAKSFVLPPQKKEDNNKINPESDGTFG